NPIGATNSPAATLTVISDTAGPMVVNVANNSSNRVVVYYSEAVDPGTATTAANYFIPGIAISSPVLSADGRFVTLTTTPMNLGASYVITINRVRDRALGLNVIETNSQFTFTVTEFFLQPIGTPGAGTITTVA